MKKRDLTIPVNHKKSIEEVGKLQIIIRLHVCFNIRMERIHRPRQKR